MALTQVKTTGIADDAVTGAKIADDTVAEANIANDAIGLTELKAGTDGQIITYDASGNPTAVGPGTDGQVLTSTGAGSPPAFETLPASNNYVHPNHSGEVTSTADGAQVIADDVVDEANLKVSNSPTNGYFLSAQSGNTGGLTWAEAAGGLDGVTTGSGNVTITNGDLIFGTGAKGIQFNNQTATSASGTSSQDTDEIINSYEFGDWTPTCTNTALSASQGHYSKIGHFVYLSCNMTFASMSGGGTVTLGGLPFATGVGCFGGIMVKYSDFSTLGDIMGHLDAGQATLHLPGTTLDEASGRRLDWSTVYTTYDF